MEMRRAGNPRAYAAEDREFEVAPSPSIRSTSHAEDDRDPIEILCESNAPRPFDATIDAESIRTSAFFVSICFRGRETFDRVPLQASDLDPSASKERDSTDLFLSSCLVVVSPSVFVLPPSVSNRIGIPRFVPNGWERLHPSSPWNPTSRTRRGNEDRLGIAMGILHAHRLAVDASDDAMCGSVFFPWSMDGTRVLGSWEGDVWRRGYPLGRPTVRE